MALTQNTVVLASAGTGKTRRLVECYTDLLDEGTDPFNIVAVTFTEKAAAEMRDRIRSAIYERLAAAPTGAKGRWTRVLAALPGAPISSIHGFCAWLLRESGADANVDPSFTILDEQRSLDLAREAAVDTIRDEIRSGAAETERLFGDLGLSTMTETIVRAAYWLNSLGKDGAWLADRVAGQESEATALRRILATEIEKYGPDFEKIGELADEVEAKKARNHPLRKRDDSRALLPRIGQIAGVRPAAELARLTGLSMARFHARKESANALDFDDLLLRARGLLRNSPAVRARYHNRFRALLIDEFQDTDEVQAEIIRLLAAPIGADPDGPARFAPGKLFIVGDQKQSIYRFRRARLQVFVRTAAGIAADDGTFEHLRDNYRSAGPIVEFSNRLCERMMDGAGRGPLPADADPSYRVRFSDMDVLKPASKRPFLGITYVAAADGVKAREGRQMDADALAHLLEGWKNSGRITTWKNVAVLMRSLVNVGIYADALEARRIPVRVIQGTQFYRKTEVSDLIAVLELVLRPNDPLLRAIVLTSSLFGVTFRDLVRNPGQSANSARLDEALQPWIERRDRATAAEILQDVIRKTAFDAVLMAQKNGRERVANVGKLIEITRSLARQGTTGLDDVVRHLRSRALDMTTREPEAQAAGSNDEAVSILSAHMAKGLEFDVVAIPDLAGKTRGNSGDSVVFSDRWGILAGASYGLHRRALPHALIIDAKEEEEDQQYEEEKRLLYVAVTRAREMLILGEGFTTRGGPWREWIEALLESVNPGSVDKARSEKRATARFRGRGQDFSVEIRSAAGFAGPEQLSLDIDVGVVNRAERFRELQAPPARPPAPLQSLEITPSDLVNLSDCFRRFHWTQILGRTEPGRASAGDSAPMRLGSAAHEAIEKGLADPSRLAALGLEELNTVFKSEAWRSLENVDVEREAPFMVAIESAVPGSPASLIRGRIDAVANLSPPRVIDYKFARWREGAQDSYRPQMLAYCLAVMKSAGLDRVTGELWFLKAPMKIVTEEFTRAESEAELSRLLDRYVEALRSDSWPMAARPDCDRLQCGFRGQCWGQTASTSPAVNI
jgi:ATP-dependent helicase/nuclease subunit A